MVMKSLIIQEIETGGLYDPINLSGIVLSRMKDER